MPQQRIIQTNFTSGELGPDMLGRVDLAQYPNGAAELRNGVVKTTGGFTRRSGSYYGGPAKSNATRTRMVPFMVSTLVAYHLEFGLNYLRIWRNRALLLASGGSTPLELATPYAVADLRALRFGQSIDVLYIFHSSYQPRKLSRTAAGVFNLAAAVFANGPYDTQNTGDVGAAPPSPATATEGTAPPPVVTGSGTGFGGDSEGAGGGGGGGVEPGGGEPGGSAGQA